MKAGLYLWGRALSKKSINLRININSERERNTRSTDKLEVSQIPNKHPSNKVH